MVKGVHKKIIEVKAPAGDYFEKAVFYLKPGVSCLPPELSEAAARMVMEELKLPAKKPAWKRLLTVFGIIAAVILVMICMVIIR